VRLSSYSDFDAPNLTRVTCKVSAKLDCRSLTFRMDASFGIVLRHYVQCASIFVCVVPTGCQKKEPTQCFAFRNLSKTYSGGARALQGVSLEITPGMFRLLAPNGAGKSTLMKILATAETPDKKFKVTLKTSSQKEKADGSGSETPMTIHDLIEVEMFSGTKEHLKRLNLHKEWIAQEMRTFESWWTENRRSRGSTSTTN